MRGKKSMAVGVVLIAAVVGALCIGTTDDLDATSSTGVAQQLAIALVPSQPGSRAVMPGPLTGFKNLQDNESSPYSQEGDTKAPARPPTIRHLMAAAAAAANSQPMDPARVSKRLATLSRANGDRLIEVLVRHEYNPSDAELAQIDALGGQVLRSYENFPFMAVRLPANRVGELARSNNVSFMDINARVLSASASARQTASVPLSGAATSYPVSTSVGVAVVDSGVAAHADLNVVDRVAFNDARTSFFGDMYDGFYDYTYRESYGSEPWSHTPWVEKGDDGAELTGKIHLRTGNCPAGDATEQCLEISANSTTSTAIERPVSLIGAREAWLGIRHMVSGVSSSAAFVVEASSNFGLTWSTVTTFSGASSGYQSYNVTPYLGPLMKIRFRVTDTDPTATLRVDDIDVWHRTSTFYRDDFETLSYSGNSWGNELWPGPWTETGDGTVSASAGTIYTGLGSTCPTSGNACMRIDAGGGVNDSIQRSLNLSGVFAAALSFDYRMVAGATPGVIVLEASKDAGATWTQLDRFSSNVQGFDKRYDLTPFATANAQIRFRVTNAVAGTVLRIDNVEANIERGNANDQLGHGTHIAGIIGGNGGSSGLQPGVARGARIHQVRVLDGRGRGTVADLIAGLDWIYTNGQSKGIKIVNMSLGAGVNESNKTDPLVYAAERLWDKGFVVIASAGNYGIFGNMTITSPGNARKIITVGSLTDMGTGSNYADDFVSLYSSRGPTLIDHVLKPDLIAPGNRHVATIPSDSRLKTAFPIRMFACSTGCSGLYMEMSGTSMAAAQVSGAALLMLTKSPTLSPATIKARLMRSARKIAGSDPTATGAGVLNVIAALNDTGVVSGQALSPLMSRSNQGSAIMVEDTATLWGNAAWGAGYLWNNGYLWSNNFTAANGYLWSDGYLWNNGYLWSNGYLWNNGYLWSNGYLWANGYLWDNAVDGGDGLAGASSSSFDLIAD